MIIKNLYHTSISCSKYNAKINETITVTVKLTDFNGNPVTNKTAKVRCSDGVYFTRETGVTNDNGEATFTLHTVDWGMQNISCNDANVMINVRGGLKKGGINKNNSNIQTLSFYYNQDTVILYIYITNAPTSTTPAQLATITEDILIPDIYFGCPSDGGTDGQIWIDSNGVVYSLFTNANQWIGIQYPRKNTIKKA